MKKFCYFTIIFFTFFFFIEKTLASDFGTCQYSTTNNSKASGTITVTLKEDRTIELKYSNQLENKEENGYIIHTVEATNKINYNDYFSGTTLDCNNVSNIYLNVTVEQSGRAGKYSYIYTKDRNTDTSYRYISNAEFTLSSSNITNSEPDKTNTTWKNICYFGSSILYIGKENYDYVGESSDIIKDASELQNLIVKNSYSCPYALCTQSTDESHGVKTVWKKFIYDASEYNSSKCVVSSTHMDDKYTCGTIISLNKQLNDGSSDRTEIIDSIKNFCSSAQKTLDYNGSDKCIQDCLTIENEISQTYNLKSDTECGVSEKFAGSINNILKWVKYIVPVIIIVLSILDFIKAIGAEKDDEMKKAQKRFIIRLVVAVLIFIMPFIIEFVLDKMGFLVENCGLDLGIGS